MVYVEIFDTRLPPPVQEQQDRKLQSGRGSLKVFGQAAKASVMTENQLTLSMLLFFSFCHVW